MENQKKQDKPRKVRKKVNKKPSRRSPNSDKNLFSSEFPAPKNGRPVLTEQQKAFLLATRSEFTAVLSQYLTWTKDEIRQALKRQKNELPILDIAVMTVLLESVINGDRPSIDWVLDHCFGKIDEKRKISIESTMPNSIDVSALSDEKLAQLTDFMESLDDKKA